MHDSSARALCATHPLRCSSHEDATLLAVLGPPRHAGVRPVLSPAPSSGLPRPLASWVRTLVLERDQRRGRSFPAARGPGLRPGPEAVFGDLTFPCPSPLRVQWHPWEPVAASRPPALQSSLPCLSGDTIPTASRSSEGPFPVPLLILPRLPKA